MSRPVPTHTRRVTAPPPSRTPSPPQTPSSATPHPSARTAAAAAAAAAKPPATSPQPASKKRRPPVARPPPPLSKRPRTRSPTAAPPTKNLRWTAIALVTALSRARERPSSALADEVAAAAAHHLCAADPARSVAAVQRNTRRRVYDALKVMEAARCISRHGKSLRWLGVSDLARASPVPPTPPHHGRLPHQPHTPVSHPRALVADARHRIATKETLAARLRETLAAYQALFIARRRRRTNLPPLPRPDQRENADESADAAEAERAAQLQRHSLPFPFVLARSTGAGAVPDLKINQRATVACLTFDAPFTLYSETDVVAMLAAPPAHAAAGTASSDAARRPRKPRPALYTQMGARERGTALFPSPPPPPPPSPAVSLAALPAVKVMDLQKHTIAEPDRPVAAKQKRDLLAEGDQVRASLSVEEEAVLATGSKEEDVAEEDAVRLTLDLDESNCTEAERCLSGKMPNRYEAEDGDEADRFLEEFEDIRDRDTLPENVFIHGLHPPATERGDNSRDAMDASQFERLPDRRKEEFAQDVDLGCEEALSSQDDPDQRKEKEKPT